MHRQQLCIIERFAVLSCQKESAKDTSCGGQIWLSLSHKFVLSCMCVVTTYLCTNTRRQRGCSLWLKLLITTAHMMCLGFPCDNLTAKCCNSNNVYKKGQASFLSERLMSQLGKRKGRVRNSSEEQSTQKGKSCSTTATNLTSSEDLASSGGETQHAILPTSDRCLTVTMEPDVSLPVSELESSVPPSSDSDYFPTPEKRQRVAIM